jgi:hypothetical protein
MLRTCCGFIFSLSEISMGVIRGFCSIALSKDYTKFSSSVSSQNDNSNAQAKSKTTIILMPVFCFFAPETGLKWAKNQSQTKCGGLDLKPRFWTTTHLCHGSI